MSSKRRANSQGVVYPNYTKTISERIQEAISAGKAKPLDPICRRVTKRVLLKKQKSDAELVTCELYIANVKQQIRDTNMYFRERLRYHNR